MVRVRVIEALRSLHWMNATNQKSSLGLGLGLGLRLGLGSGLGLEV